MYSEVSPIALNSTYCQESEITIASESNVYCISYCIKAILLYKSNIYCILFIMFFLGCLHFTFLFSLHFNFFYILHLLGVYITLSSFEVTLNQRIYYDKSELIDSLQEVN